MIPQNLQRRVGTDDTTVTPQKLAIGKHAADPLLGEKIVPGAREESLRGLAKRGIARAHRLAWSLVVGELETQRGLADLARHLRGVLRIDNGPRMNDGGWSADPEVVDAFEEKRAQLRVVDGKALVDFDLLAIRFDLREVRIVGEVERQVRRDAVLDAKADIFRVRGAKRTRGRVQRACRDRGERRERLEVPARREVRDALDHAHLTQIPDDVVRHRRPMDGLVVRLDLALDLKSPPV